MQLNSQVVEGVCGVCVAVVGGGGQTITNEEKTKDFSWGGANVISVVLKKNTKKGFYTGEDLKVYHFNKKKEKKNLR